MISFLIEGINWIVKLSSYLYRILKFSSVCWWDNLLVIRQNTIFPCTSIMFQSWLFNFWCYPTYAWLTSWGDPLMKVYSALVQCSQNVWLCRLLCFLSLLVVNGLPLHWLTIQLYQYTSSTFFPSCAPEYTYMTGQKVHALYS